MNIPTDVVREVEALRGEIERLLVGPWDQAGSTNAGRNLRSRAESVVLAAKKVKEAVAQNSYSPR